MDEKQQAAIDKAAAKAEKAERSRINGLIRDAKTAAGEIENRDEKRAVKQALTDLQNQIKAA